VRDVRANQAIAPAGGVNHPGLQRRLPRRRQVSALLRHPRAAPRIVSLACPRGRDRTTQNPGLHRLCAVPHRV